MPHPTPSPQLVLKPDDPVQIAWLHEGDLAWVTMTDTSREAVDLFVETIISVFEQWPQDRPILILYDARQIGFTPYLRERTRYAADTTPDRRGRTAFLMTRSTVHRILQFALMRRLNDKQELKRAIYFDETAALAWLREWLPNEHLHRS